MTPDRWAEVERLYHAALTRALSERAAFLREACRGDETLRREVEALLAQSATGDFLAAPAIAVPANSMSTPGVSAWIGRRIGVYQIHAPLGVGGMGEVYRARDTKLGRDVAIKVLPRAFTSEPERLARFEREARMLAALNHPNIGSIYGFEDADGIRALILELVDGETLADRIARGPLAVKEALPIARQIAEALEAAHEKGIIHRDLKPGNIALTRDRTVKVLDFGLAKTSNTDARPSDGSGAPTMTIAGTQDGLVLGTASYMSPEQARGQAVDKRTDIWAFGCVLFEMLIGHVAFPGKTIPDTLAGILERDPNWALLPATTPPAIRRLLERCLEKDVKRRVRDIGDAAIELSDAISPPANVSPALPAAAVRPKERFAWLAVASVLALVIAALGVRTFRPPQTPSEMQFEITTPAVVDPEDLPSFAISPDSQTLVFLGTDQGQPLLWTRPLNTVAAHPLTGTREAFLPFWSPDSRSIAFYAEGVLKRIDLDGGLVRPLAKASFGAGGSWNNDGVILFSKNPASPIYRISDEGESEAAVTSLDAGQAGHTFPHFLPDGRHFLYLVAGAPDVRGIYIGQLDGATPQKLFDADAGAVYASGHLLFIRERTLWAQPFDAARLELKGSPFAVTESLLGRMGFFNTISAAPGGALAFRTGSARKEQQFVWFDRTTGREVSRVGDADDAAPSQISPSPDGEHLVLARRGPSVDLWRLEIRRGVLSRFTTDPSEDIFPAWSHDGSRIVFTSNRNGGFALYQKRTTGSQSEELLLPGQPGETFALDADSRFLIYQHRDATNGWDIWVLPFDGGMPAPLIHTEADERDGQLSPDGKRLAYVSNKSGRFEVFVESFPGRETQTQVSTSGGMQVRWRPDGRELYYVAYDGRLMAAPVHAAANGSDLEVGTAVPLFATPIGHVLKAGPGADYVVSADGQRFLINTIVPISSPTPIRLVLNWHPRP